MKIQTSAAPRSTIRLPQSLWDRLDRIASARLRSRNTEVLVALEAYAAREERKIQKSG